MALRDLGFGREQETAYRLLLADADRRADQLVPGTNGDPAAVLGDLVALGVLRPRADAVCGFAALDPTVALGELIERTEDELQERLRRVGATRSEVAGLVELHRSADAGATAGPQDGVERVMGVTHVRERLAELSFFARRSVWTVQPSVSGPPEAVAAARPLEARGVRRGLDIRVLYPRAVLDDPTAAARLRARGSGVRFGGAPTQRMIILDEEVVVLGQDPAAGAGALIVRQPGIVTPMIDLFRSMWDAASITASDAVDPVPVTDADRLTLELLGSGATDERVARELGVSVRHARRRVAKLMSDLQARSRFEAGAAAARRGWI